MKKVQYSKPLAIMAMVVLLTACKGPAAIVDPVTMLAYCKEPTEQTLENLSKSYAAVINKSRKTGVKTPGVYSDYAVCLVAQGKRAEANSWFNKEMESFPSSRGYVMQLKRQLIPEYQNDNRVTTQEAAEESVDSLTPKQRQAAEKRASAAVDGQAAEEAVEKPTDEEAGKEDTDNQNQKEQ